MKRTVVVVFVLLAMFLLPSFARAHEHGPSWWNRSDFRPVIQALEARGFDREELLEVFSSPHVAWYPNLPRFLPRERSEDDPYEKFLTKESVDRGKWFLMRYHGVLEKVENDYGVPREILTAILRIESDFTKNTGSYQAFGVFTSVIRWSHSAKRKNSAKKELIALFEVAEISDMHPLEIYSSWAGAFGISQFMPTSYLAFRADGNHDGVINLFNLEDGLASTANYLVSHNWKTNSRGSVHDYNHSWAYVGFVFEYAKALGWEE